MRLRHAVPRSRRGVELAINTVVVLILGVIIVGGGVAMVSVILHEGETIAKEVSQAQMRQLDTLYGQGYLVAVTPKRVDVRAGDTAVFALGAQNILKTPEVFAVNVVGTGPDGLPVPLGSQVGSWRVQYFPDLPVDPDKSAASPMGFTPPDTAARGVYTFIVTLKQANGAIYDSPRGFTVVVE